MPGRRGSKRKLDEKEYGEQNGLASKNAAIPANNISEVLSLMQQTETAVHRADERFGRNQTRLEENQEELSRLMNRVHALKAEARRLIKEMDADKVTAKTGRKQLTNLRFWGNACAFTDLPHELLSMVFQYLGYVHQQRLVRVSRVWKDLITSLDHIYCDALLFFDFRVDRSGFRTRKIRKYRAIEMDNLTPVELATKTREQDREYRFRTVRHLTLDGMLLVDAYQLARQGLDLAKRFPNLVTLNFTRVEVSWAGVSHAVLNFISQHPAVRVIISQAMVRALPGTADDSVSGRKVLADRLHSYRRMSNFTVPANIPVDASDDALHAFMDDMIWPYSDQQISWMARYAPHLNDRMMSIYYDVTWSPQACLDCNKLFCFHRDVAFYKNELSTPSLNVLAIFILRMRIPDMEPPPVPFQFEQLRLINGRYQLVPEV